MSKNKAGITNRKSPQEEEKLQRKLPERGKSRLEKPRKDEVGRSGVYLMSGPLPPGNAPLRGQMEWGQGKRGAAGYYDHGDSELNPELEGRQQGQTKSPKRQSIRRGKEPRKNRAA